MTATLESRRRHAPVKVYPIRDERDRQAALKRIGDLMDVKTRSEHQRDELDVLFTLVDDYERRNYPHQRGTPREILDSLLTDGGHKQIDVARGAGILPSTLNEILRGKREINARQAVKLARYFKLPADMFLPQDV